jgi:hypothetical protein
MNQMLVHSLQPVTHGKHSSQKEGKKASPFAAISLFCMEGTSQHFKTADLGAIITRWDNGIQMPSPEAGLTTAYSRNSVESQGDDSCDD